jgi:hypothetical protein
MKVLILFILCFWLLPPPLVWGEHRECWPCYICLDDCECGDGSECCREAKKECCKNCRFTSGHYQACLDRVDSKESYIEHRTKSKLNKWRQQFEDEMEDMQ